MINSVQGKTIENLRKRINGRLANNEKHCLKYIKRPPHITHKIFDKKYAALHEIKAVLTLNKPIYVRFIVLELSKWLMYDFHYNFVKKHFDAELSFTDTDSLTYERKSEDVYEEFFKHKHLFNFSNYPKDSNFFDQTNKNIIDKIKYVSEGKVIDQFVELKSKMYSVKNFDGKESNTTKRVNIATEFNEFKGSLFNKKSNQTQNEKNSKQENIILEYTKSTKYHHRVLMIKRFVLDDGIDTLAYFHKNLKKQILTDHHK